jgi:hypothetical protein
MRKKLATALVLLFAVSAMIAFNTGTAAAAFHKGKIIDDGIFNFSGAMNASQIDSFLNSFSNSCISPNRGFSAPNPTGYSPSGGYTYGGNVSAGTVIENAAKAYDLNPRVLLATLQKEQSLVNGNAGCSTLRYVGATGYGCPDSGTTHDYSGLNLYTINGNTTTSVTGTCVNSSLKAGFSQQVIRAAWLLKFGQQRSLGNTGWAIIRGSWDNSDDLQSCYTGPMTEGMRKTCPNGSATYYDGYRSIDGESIYLENGATAAMYWYTPHLHGNENFVVIWESWWGVGSTNTPTFLWEKVGMKIWDEGRNAEMGTDWVKRGERMLVEVTAKNVGNQPWWRDHTNQARLGLQAPNPHRSQYCDVTWIWCSRAAVLQEASVMPGETGHFTFYIHAPNQGGVFREWYEPILESFSWMDNDQGFNIYVNSVDTYNWGWLYFDAYTDSSKTARVSMDNLGRRQNVYLELKIRNDSATVWTNSDPNPLRLGTQSPQDHCSDQYTSNWTACNRPATLIESQVVPGQVGTFGFTIQAPDKVGQWREFVKPVIEFKGWMKDTPNHIYMNVTH